MPSRLNIKCSSYFFVKVLHLIIETDSLLCPTRAGYFITTLKNVVLCYPLAYIEEFFKVIGIPLEMVLG